MSAFLDFLEWVKEPGQASLNVLSGRPDAAKRHLLDFLAGPVDAVLPGDVLPEQAGPEDEAAPTGNQTIDDLLGAAVNPITYLPLSPTVRRAALQAGKSAIRPTWAPEPVQDFMGKVRRTAGWDALDPNIDEKIRSAGALGAMTGRSGSAYLESMVGNRVGTLGRTEDEALADVIDNMRRDAQGKPLWDPANPAAVRLDQTMGPGNYTGAAGEPLHVRIAKAQGRLDLWRQANPGKLDASRVNGLKDLLADYYQFADTQLAEAKSIGALAPDQTQADYLQRIYENAPGRAGAGAGRVFEDPEKIAEFLATSPKDVNLNRSFVERAAVRAEGQANLVRKAKLAESLGITDPLYSEGFKTAAGARLKPFEATGDDTYQRLRYELNMDGIADPGPVEKVMMRVNRIFKPAAVYGVGPFVRVGSIFRNQLTEVQQRLTDPQLAAAAAKDPAYFARNIWGAFNDALSDMTGKRVSKDELGEAFELLKTAGTTGKGEALGQVAELRRLGRGSQVAETMAEALEHGVLEGFARSETLGTNLVARGGSMPSWMQYWFVPGNKGFNMGQSLFSGLENRMRYTMFSDLRKAGVPPAEAARRVDDAALDYSVSSTGNRNLRAWFPFAQFALQTIPQQAKFAAAVPGALTGTAALFNTQDEPDFAPYQVTKSGLSTGAESRLQGLGSPAEVFNLFPAELGSLGAASEALRQGPGSMLHPLPKTAVQLLTGEDLFRGQEWDPRLPGRTMKDERTVADTMWGIGESAGLLTPLGSPARAALGVSNDPISGGVRFLTGLESVGADALRAEAQRLQSALGNEPTIRESTLFYAGESAPQDALDQLDRLQKVRKELAARAAQ